MKTTLLTISLMLAVAVSSAQKDTASLKVSRNLLQTIKYEANENKWTMASAFFAGFCEGNREILRHDYEAFKRVWPNANDDFWNPGISWKNKWRDGDPSKGEAFFGSTSFLVPFTDGLHLTGSGRTLGWMTTVTFNIGEKKTFKSLLTEMALHWCAYSAGFNVTYHGLYGHPLFRGKAGR